MSAACRPRRYGAVNWRGLMTLALKDIRRTIKSYRYAILGPVISNLLFLTVFQLALGEGATRVGALDFLQFLAPGLIIFTVCERSFGSASESLLFDKQEGMLADTLMAPLTPIELTLGYAAGAAGSGLITGAAVAAAILPFVALPVASLSLLLFFAIGGALMTVLSASSSGCGPSAGTIRPPPPPFSSFPSPFSPAPSTRSRRCPISAASS